MATTMITTVLVSFPEGISGADPAETGSDGTGVGEFDLAGVDGVGNTDCVAVGVMVGVGDGVNVAPNNRGAAVGVEKMSIGFESSGEPIIWTLNRESLMRIV